MVSILGKTMLWIIGPNDKQISVCLERYMVRDPTRNKVKETHLSHYVSG